MKILVCVKVVNGELNPFDESALECALRLSSDVTVITMGPLSNEKVLKGLTRLGTKVILVSDNLYAGSDTLATSYVLSTAIKRMDYDLILCGRQSIDGDTAQVGPMLSEKLGISLITNAMDVKSLEDSVVVSTRTETKKVKTPILITMERSFVLRFPSIFSKQGDVMVISNETLLCNKEKCGLSGSPTRVIKTFENEIGKRKCKFISMEEIPSLIEELKNKEKTEEKSETPGTKLKKVWAIGPEVLEKAEKVAEEVILIDKLSPEEIFEKALKEKPEVILWNADLWGRKNAPLVASKLNTGLCADCTALETDGENLIMVRPARGGNVTAKILCNTKPVMATVRTKAASSEIIVSGGRGVADKTDKLKEFAKTLGGEVGASRGLVDLNKIPYEAQIGLTGKTVSPKIYVAVGISGAVHHTCAIEGSDTVIAINPDKDARIFEYADYGVLSEF